MRRVVIVLVLVLAAGCFHDNASPMVHGAKNAPSRGGSTHTPRTDTTSTTTAVDFGGSSGNGGGYIKVGGAAGGGAAAATATGVGNAPATSSGATTTR